MATDSITDKNTLKSWFKRGLKPLETQFHAWIDSFWHKNEEIPTSSIRGLESTLNNKAEIIALDALSDGLEGHVRDSALHKTAGEQVKLDNLADNPNMTYATREELMESDEFNHITLDLDLIETDSDLMTSQSIFNSINEQFGHVIDFDKPFVFLFTKLIDDGRTQTLVTDCVIDTAKAITTSGKNRYEFHIALSNTDIISCVGKRNIIIGCIDDYGFFITQMYNAHGKEVIFLSENGDGYITLQDHKEIVAMGLKSDPWSFFYHKLLQKEYPAVYLKSQESELFYPAAYHFVPSESDSKILDGNIRISYVHDNVLCIEDRKFERNNNGGFAGHGSTMSDFSIQKIPLNKEFDYLILNLDLMTPENGLQTQAFKDDVANQFLKFDGNLPVIVRIKVQNKADIFGFVERYDYYEDQGVKTFTVDLSVNDLEVAGMLGGDSLSITVINRNTEQSQQLRITVACHGFTYSKTLFLYDDNDGFIAVRDTFMLESNWNKMHSIWNDFYDELKFGRLPAVYLRSKESGAFCPATYEFVPKDASIPDIFKGNIEISYYKTLDGQKYLCRENRVFTHFIGEGSTYEVVHNGNGEYVLDIEKFPLS